MIIDLPQITYQASLMNPYKQNQDAFITSPHILQLKHCHFFSVCDGHGLLGHDVSGLLNIGCLSMLSNS